MALSPDEKSEHQHRLSEETIASLRELGAVLEEIRRDLLADGYVIKDGKIYKKGDEPLSTNQNFLG